MSNAIVDVRGVSANESMVGLIPPSIFCPKCCARNFICPMEWAAYQKAGKCWLCRSCGEDMMDASAIDDEAEPKNDEAVTLRTLTSRQRDVLQAIKEYQPIRHEELAVKAGVSERTVTNAVRVLKHLGVKLSGAGYIYEELP